MQLPAHLLTSTLQVVALVEGPRDALGQATKTWQPVGPAQPCAHYPAGAKVLELAQLRQVKVAREVYVPRLAVDPLNQRVVIDGVQYTVTLVNAWPGFTVLGVTT